MWLKACLPRQSSNALDCRPTLNVCARGVSVSLSERCRLGPPQWRERACSAQLWRRPRGWTRGLSSGLAVINGLHRRLSFQFRL